MAASVSVPRPRSRSASSAMLGGAMNTAIASGSAARTARAPMSSISRITSSPRASLASTSPRSVPYRLPLYSTHSRKSPAATRRSERGLVQEVVLAAVVLARPRRARRRRHGRHDVREPLADEGDDGPLPGARGPRDDEDRGDGVSLRSRRAARARWRSERPPTVLLGLMRHCSMMRADLTRPHLGAAMRRSATLAVSRNSGGARGPR